MRILYTILVGLSTSLTYGQSNKLEREGEPDIFQLASEDEGMNAAIKTARKNFNVFLDVFEDKKNPQYYYSIKVAFEANIEIEHIWLTDITKKKSKLFGKVGNVPEYVKNIELNQSIEINSKWISDWFYIKNGKLIGGYTIRVLRDRMTPSQRRDFDLQFGVEF